MTKHTPGPWHVKGEGSIRITNGWIARVHWQNRAANARLIAAAPDLYEALKYARRFLNAEDHDVAFVDAILAKAEGR